MNTKALLPGAAVAFAAVIGISGVSFAHADSTNYKQAFTASSATMSGVFDVAGDESSITYYLAGTTSGSLECQAGNGSLIDVTDLSGSGAITPSGILPAAMQCNPAINTTAHLVQDMREGKISLVSGGTTLLLQSGVISTVPPAVTGGSDTSTTTPTTGTGNTTPTMGTGTGTTTPGTGDMGTSTAPIIGTTTDPVLGTTTVSASDLRVALNNILRGHVSTSLEVLRSISNMPAGATTSPELAATLAVQDQNAIDLSNAIGSVYGPAADTAFLALFRAHIVDSNNYTIAVKNGNMADQTAALADLDLQLKGIASFLSTANPNLNYDGLLAGLRAHENLVNESSVDYAQGDYSDAYAIEQQALAQISGAGDFISAGIVAQYPGSFTK